MFLKADFVVYRRDCRRARVEAGKPTRRYRNRYASQWCPGHKGENKLGSTYILKVQSKDLGRSALGKESQSLTGGCLCTEKERQPIFWAWKPYSSPRTRRFLLVGVFLNPEIKNIRFFIVHVIHGFLYEWSCLLLGAVYKNTFLIQLFLAAYILVISMVLIWFSCLNSPPLNCISHIAWNLFWAVFPGHCPSFWELFTPISGNGLVCHVILYRQPV